MSCSGRKLMGPHSVGPQVCGKVRCSFSCLVVMSAAAARAPKAPASPAPLHDHTLLQDSVDCLPRHILQETVIHMLPSTHKTKTVCNTLDKQMFCRLRDLPSIYACSI